MLLLGFRKAFVFSTVHTCVRPAVTCSFAPVESCLAGHESLSQGQRLRSQEFGSPPAPARDGGPDIFHGSRTAARISWADEPCRAAPRTTSKRLGRLGSAKSLGSAEFAVREPSTAVAVSAGLPSTHPGSKARPRALTVYVDRARQLGASLGRLTAPWRTCHGGLGLAMH